MTKQNQQNKNWIKWLLVGFIVLSVLVGFKLYKLKKAQAIKREFVEKQRDIMMKKWQEEGLTEQEIKTKMQNMRQKRRDSGEKSPEGLMRMRKNMMRMHP